MTKPAVFIASSVEGLRIADAINANLDHETHCTIWRHGTFKLSSQTVDDLVKKTSAIDFAIFAFTPDDVATIRNHEEAIARDNVVFELGLFIGAIGKDRCYIVKPRGVTMHLPSDLLGMNFADYATDRPDDDIASALNYACNQIRGRITELGSIDRSSFARAQGLTRPVPNPPDYKLQDADLLFLGECVKSQVSSPVGRSFGEIERQVKGHSEHSLMLSAIKLERLGYIEKTVEQGDGNWEYFAFTATSDGLDEFLRQEARVADLTSPSQPGPNRPLRNKVAPRPSTGFEDRDDVPF